MAKSSKDVMLPHSKAKVDFYQKYLERYLLILNAAKFTKEINIYDVFCGRGVYDDGGLGSAIRAMDTIIKVRKEHPARGKKVCLYLNDMNPKHVKSIRDYFLEHYQDKKGRPEVYLSNKDAVDRLNEIYDYNAFYAAKKGILHFFFIDPYGYKNITKEMLRNLMRLGNTEILLFLPVSFMHRFHRYAFDENANQGALPLRNFINSFFPDSRHPVRCDEPIDIYDYINYLSRAFSFNGQFLTTSYSIERDSRNHFALFFISSSFCGFEQMLDIKYRLIDEFGFGFHLPERQTDLFADYFREDKLCEIKEELRSKLLYMLLQKPLDNCFIYRWLLHHEYHPKMAKDVFRDLYKENLLIITSLATGKLVAKNTFYLDYHHSKRPELIYSLIK